MPARSFFPFSALLSIALFPVEIGAAPPIPSPPVFVDRALDTGVTVENRCGADPRYFIPEGNGCGAGWLDYDLDGDLDLYVVNGNGLDYGEDRRRLTYLRDATNRLYRNDGDWRFTDVTEEAGVGDRGWGNGCGVADVDEDGDPDLYVANLGPDVLYVNRGDGTFAEESAIRGIDSPGWSVGVAFGDVDLDGDLDLFVPAYVDFDPMNPPAGGELLEYEGVMTSWGPEGENEGVNIGAPNTFYLNDGNGHFTEATAERGLDREKALCSYSAVILDADGDGWPDILVTNDVQPNSFFRNLGDGTFREEGEERGFARGEEGKAQAGMGLAVADVDDDGDPDAFVTNFDFEPNNLYLNDGAGMFEDVGGPAGLHEPVITRLGWGCRFLDLELDGDLDLILANGHVIRQCEEMGMSPWKMANQVFLRDGETDGRPIYREAVFPDGSPLALVESSRGVAVADVDNDGDLDVAIIDLDRRPQLLENRTPRAGHWLRVKAVGTEGARDAYGARVEVECGESVRTNWVLPNQGVYSSHDPRVHFGLGDSAVVDRLTVRFPSGATVSLADVPVDREVVVTEPAAGTGPESGRP